VEVLNADISPKCEFCRRFEIGAHQLIHNRKANIFILKATKLTFWFQRVLITVLARAGRPRLSSHPRLVRTTPSISHYSQRNHRGSPPS